MVGGPFVLPGAQLPCPHPKGLLPTGLPPEPSTLLAVPVKLVHFFFETAQPTATQLEAIRYIDEVLQAEDIALVESVQRGMATPGFTQGRIVYDEGGSGRSEHAVHHFHGLIQDAYAHADR